jgi:hypothetical protein
MGFLRGEGASHYSSRARAEGFGYGGPSPLALANTTQLLRTTYIANTRVLEVELANTFTRKRVIYGPPSSTPMWRWSPRTNWSLLVVLLAPLA